MSMIGDMSNRQDGEDTARMSHVAPEDVIIWHDHPFSLMSQAIKCESMAILPQIAENSDTEKQRRILIVDDEAFNQIGLLTVLQTMGRFQGLIELVDLANDGKEAVEKARAGLLGEGSDGCIYSLVFMDLSMPVMNGFEASDILRELY